jgi:hypothetical protein
VGVLAYYWLQSAPTTPLKLELLDSSGEVRACAASDTPMKPVDTEKIDVQAIWREPAPPPMATAGVHRFALNVKQSRGEDFGGGPATPAPKDACTGSLPVKPTAARGPGRRTLVALEPGNYIVRLSVDGRTYTQPAAVAPDPRGAHPYNPSDDTDNHNN